MPTADTRFRNEFFASDHGIIGSTTEDYLAKLQALIDRVSADGGGTIILSSGTYRLSNTLTLQDNIIIRGQGRRKTTLLFDGPGGLLCHNKKWCTIENLHVWSQGTSPWAVKISCSIDQLVEYFTANDCDITNEYQPNAAAVHIEGTAGGVGGYGIVYYTTFNNCRVSGPISSAALRVGTAGYRVSVNNAPTLYLRVVGGQTCYSARHFDFGNTWGNRIWGVECDGNVTTVPGEGRYVYLGPIAAHNQFLGMHFEPDGMDKSVEFHSLSYNNVVESSTTCFISSIVGAPDGKPIYHPGALPNSIKGFTSETPSQANTDGRATHFSDLRQDFIYERVPNAGVNIDGATLYDGGLIGHLWRPDKAGLQVAINNGNATVYDNLILRAGGTGRQITWLAGSFVASSTNNSAFNCASHQFPASTSAMIEWTVVARRTGGSRATGAVGDSAMFKVMSAMISPVSTIINVLGYNVTDTFMSPDLAAAGVQVVGVLSGGGSGIVVLQVRGATGVDLDWVTEIKITSGG